MAGTGTALARIATVSENCSLEQEPLGQEHAAAGVQAAGASGEIRNASVEVPARARQGAYTFFWVVALAGINSLFAVLGSHVHRFTGFGVTALTEKLAPAASSVAMQTIVSGWLAGVLLVFGRGAIKGQRWSFIAGMALYAADGALLAALGSYFSVAVHVCMLYGMYSGLDALKKSKTPAEAESCGCSGELSREVSSEDAMAAESNVL